MTGVDEAVGIARARGKELEENGFGVVLEKKGGGAGSPSPLLLSGLSVLWKPLFTVLAFPGLFGLAGLFVSPLNQLGIGGPAVNADGRLGVELLFDFAGELAVLAELLGLALGVDDLPLGWVHPVLGELAANRPDVLKDFSQCVGEDVYSGWAAF
jgi:hypothetical protein